MGFLTVLKKMRQKEKEMRILLLYPFYKEKKENKENNDKRDVSPATA